MHSSLSLLIPRQLHRTRPWRLWRQILHDLKSINLIIDRCPCRIHEMEYRLPQRKSMVLDSRISRSILLLIVICDNAFALVRSSIVVVFVRCPIARYAPGSSRASITSRRRRVILFRHGFCKGVSIAIKSIIEIIVHTSCINPLAVYINRCGKI